MAIYNVSIDPFCDFDLIFSNSYYGSKILEYECTTGVENMVRLIFQDLKMAGG